MYKVVLIDDEAIIVEGLRKVVDWAGFGCVVVATASCAAEGAAAIRMHAPDIVFTDIKMPDTDGMTMLAGLKSEFPAMQITVLTGYRDFAYAQEAVRLGVTRLLLKPSRMDEINEAMRTMVANLQGKPATPPTPEGEGQSAGSFIVRQATEYIEEHYSEKLTLQEIADHCYVSQWHLSKLLNKHTGKSFYDLLNLARIGAAKRLLADPSLKIGDICEMVGYADTGHFSRVFKKTEGMSANEYRNSHHFL
ncbi:MAG: response regulator [Eubacteriales bacterium]|nr:response regulator [Eubacteriales bacterium]